MWNLFEIIVYAEQILYDLIKDGLASDQVIKVAGRACNASELEKMVLERKQVVVLVGAAGSLDNEARNILRYLKKAKIPSLALCENVAEGFSAMQEGATAMMVKPRSMESADTASFLNILKTKIKTIQKQSELDTRVLKQDRGLSFHKFVVIGSSTGGTETIIQIVKEFRADMPPVLIVQHMPPVFTKLYAERMNTVCNLTVWEAQDGDLLRPGLVLVAPGDFHMTLTRINGHYAVKCEKGEKVNGHCPSVDQMFYSVAKMAGAEAVGVILTGMGADGAHGLLEMRKKGAMTLGQDAESCVVYGMPKVAHEIGAVARQVSLSEMAKVIMECL